MVPPCASVLKLHIFWGLHTSLPLSSNTKLFTLLPRGLCIDYFHCLKVWFWRSHLCKCSLYYHIMNQEKKSCFHKDAFILIWPQTEKISYEYVKEFSEIWGKVHEDYRRYISHLSLCFAAITNNLNIQWLTAARVFMLKLPICCESAVALFPEASSLQDERTKKRLGRLLTFTPFKESMTLNEGTPHHFPYMNNL